MPKEQHTDNLSKTLKLSEETGIEPTKSEVKNTLQQSGKSELKKLSSISDKSFDNVYITAMIQDHEQALAIIDQKLLKNVTNKSIRAFILSTRTHIEDHLKQAQTIQQNGI